MKRIPLILGLLWLTTGTASAQIQFGVARMDDKGVLHLREFCNAAPRTDEVEVMQMDRDGRAVKVKVKITHQMLSEHAMRLDASFVKGMDGTGKEITATDLTKRLSQETPVVILDRGAKLSPNLAAVLKKEILVLGLPFSMTALQASGCASAGVDPLLVPAPAAPDR